VFEGFDKSFPVKGQPVEMDLCLFAPFPDFRPFEDHYFSTAV
jgi:hypothetical protein